MKLISKIIYFIFGWKAVGDVPDGISKAVLIIAPHTSNLDFYIGTLYTWIRGIPGNVLVKKEAFKWPLVGIIKKLGGIPIDRSKSNSKVAQIVNMFSEREILFLAITPEGTRKRNDNWKMGFYHIAVKANVPILLCYIDYKLKRAGIGEPFWPTGNMEEDFKKIEDFYRGRNAKHPEFFNLN